MADAPTQDGRIGKLATPLGKDKLCLTRFEGTEAIGELFEYHIEALSTDANINFKTALGKTCSVHLETTDHAGRDFSGILTKAKWAGTRFNFQVYQLVLRPWPWLMTLRSYCRIFSNMNVKDIVKDALGKNEFGAIVDLMQPNLIHITGVVPYEGNRVVDLTSDGHQFGLLIPEDGKKVFLTGPIDASPQSKNARVMTCA